MTAKRNVIRKKDIVEKLMETSCRRDRIGSAAAADDIVNEVLGLVASSVLGGSNVQIPGFGTLTVKEYRGRRSRSIRTGEIMHTPPCFGVTFNITPAAKKELQRLNGTSQHL